eukprot:Phypoly_transcript_11267.p1 GENE.Phypoly_transcript_11267~~Phypoly_transcript_11267.p1  ORF type:complete len:354 (+),score=65.82 Phypoly_transcript_11267:157-1218(+)
MGLHTTKIIWVVLSLVVISTATSITCPAEDGSIKTLPSSHLNDDYCDCVVSGEDETITAACAHLPNKFICKKNVDKKAISFSFVGDKFCDCCDGSDEEAGLCPDVCSKEWEEEIARVQGEIEKHSKGETIKKTYIKQGNHGVKQLDGVVKQLRKEVQADQEELQSKIYSQTSTQQALQQMYVMLMQKNQQLQTLETLSTTPSSFGPKREYFPLFGKCFAMQSNEKHFKGGSFENVAKDFLFEVCPFERITQMGTESGATPTLLGVWQGWHPESDNVMVFSGGDECWNGPNRVVNLQMECGLDDKLVDVRENGKCTYEFVFASPAACSKKHADKLKKYLKQISPEEKEITHDEL